MKLQSYFSSNGNFLLILILMGFAVRLLISWFSIGTNDAYNIPAFGRYIFENGIFGVYSYFNGINVYFGGINGFQVYLMNHPPLMGLWFSLSIGIGELMDCCFRFVFRLLPILADAGTCYILYKIFSNSDNKIKGLSVAAAYSWCCAAILVSGYHHNTDNVYAFFCLLTAYFVQEKKAFFFAGLALGCAINVKLIPVILIMPLFLLCRNKNDFLKVFIGLSIGAIPYLFGIIFIGDSFVNNVLGYKGITSFWGVTNLFSVFNFFNPSVENFYDFYYCVFIQYIVLILSAALSWYLKRKSIFSAYEVLVMPICLFFLLTPAMATQYLVGIIPLLFVANLKQAQNFGYIGGFFILVCYAVNWTGTVPFYSEFSAVIPIHAFVIGIPVYFILLKFFIITLRKKKPH